MVDKVSYEKIIAPVYEYLSSQPQYENTLVSFPIPCVYNRMLLDMFFTYRRETISENESVIEVDELLVSNPYTKSIVARFETNYVSDVFSSKTNNLTYSQYKKLRNNFMSIYEIIRPFAFETSIDAGRQQNTKLFIKTFTKLFEPNLRKVYCEIGEVFFKWALLIAGGNK